jgi:hypothetical protein
LSGNIEVIATELRLFKEELSRRFDEIRDDVRNMRSDMATNYVHHQAYHSDIGRVNDRIANVEADVVDLRTTIAADKAERNTESRWTKGQIVTAAVAILMAAIAIAAALIEAH